MKIKIFIFIIFLFAVFPKNVFAACGDCICDSGGYRIGDECVGIKCKDCAPDGSCSSHSQCYCDCPPGSDSEPSTCYGVTYSIGSSNPVAGQPFRIYIDRASAVSCNGNWDNVDTQLDGGACDEGLEIDGATGYYKDFSGGLSAGNHTFKLAVNTTGGSCDCVCNAFTFNISSPTPTPMPTTILPTSTSVLTPTPTSISATSTPIPTSTPVPTSTPTPGTRNHVCDTDFYDETSGKQVVAFVVTVRDDDALPDGEEISRVKLRIGSEAENIFTLNYDIDAGSSVTGGLGSKVSMTASASVGGTDKTVSFLVMFNDLNGWPVSVNGYDLYVYVEDKYGVFLTGGVNGWVDIGRKFKIWDCKVSVSGTMYDGAGNDLCPICPGGICFVDLATEEMNFASLSFGSNGMTVTSPTYSDGGNKLIWGQTYAVGSNISFNEDLAGVVPVMRLPEAPAGGECDALTVDETAGVSAYEISPAARADFSSVLIHDPWFQVVGAGIKAKQSVVDDIPLMCVNDVLCAAAMTVSEVADVDNGLVAGVTVESGSGQYGLPLNNWVYRSNIVGQNCRYQDFYNRFYVLRGVGETQTGNVNMSDLSSSGLIFVNGNLTINENNTVDVGDFLMVAVSGVIGIEEGVDNVEGVFVADQGISVGGESDTQLNIYGSLCTAGNVAFARGYADGRVNGHAPAVKINFRPDFAFGMPGELTKTLSGWKEGN